MMPLTSDPSVGASLLTPRGFIPLPGSDEETRPINPEAPKPEELVAPDWSPSPIEKVISTAIGAINPLAGAAAYLSTSPTVQAAFRESNTVGSAIAKTQDTFGVNNDLVDITYNPWKEVAGTKYEPYWNNVFAYSNNTAYTNALKQSIDRQENDRRTVEASGFGGTVAGILAGTIDPTLLIPVGGEVTLVGKGTWAVGKGLARGAKAGAVGIGTQELGLQASQDIRSAEESVFNVGTGVVLGAVLGGGIAGALSRTQRVGAEAALEKIANEPIPGSVGAAAPERMSLDDLSISGTITKNIAAGTAFSPNLRGNFRESPLARQTYQELATNTLRQNMHITGGSIGGSVEDNILVSLGETLGQALEAHPDFFRNGKKAGFGMSADQFDEAIGQAMRRGDIGANDAVSSAAKMWRSKVIDPLTRQAIELEMLPKDVKVIEAPSYFSRMYNNDRMIARKPEFIDIATKHYDGILHENYEKEAGKLREKQAEFDEELKGLKARKDKERIAEIKLLKAELDRKFYDKWEVRRLGEDVSPYKPESVPNFAAHAKDMAGETYDAITGQDYGSASVDPGINFAAKSGPLKDRTFHIPDEKIEPFLEDNVVRVMTRFARTMSAQLELARKFPNDPLLTERFQAIKREYDTLIEHAKTEGERTKLEKDRRGAFNDLRALLEIHRGSYKVKENASSWGRTVRGLMNFNYIRSMGGSAIPSLSDMYNPAVFHGFGRTMQAGIPNLIKGIDNIAKAGLIKEAKYAGVAERLAHHRLLTLAEIGDPYSRGNAIERLLQNGIYVASKWNGLNILTDFEKNFSAIVVQDRLNGALLKGTDDPFLAYSGMNETTRTRVAKQLKLHGEEVDGITIANTDQWEDFDAIRAYRVAISRNVNADVVTRGVGDVPLLAYTPLGKLLLQFKTFNLAAHQRTMLRAMQLGPAQFLSGMIGLTTIGMIASTLAAWRGGEVNWEKFKESGDPNSPNFNPGYLISEGLDRTGFFTLPIEIGNVTEKVTAPSGYAFNPTKAPLLLAGKLVNPDASLQGNSQRFAGRGALSALAGPSGGILEDAALAAGGVIDAARGKEVKQGKKNAATRIVPYGSYIGMREVLQLLTDNSPYTE